MEAVTDPALRHLPFEPRNLGSSSFSAPNETLGSQLGPDFDPNNYYSSANNVYAQAQPQPRARLQSQQVNGRRQPISQSPTSRNAQSGENTFNTPNGVRYHGLASGQHYNNRQPLNLYTPVQALQQQGNSPGGYHGGTSDHNPNGGNEDGGKHFSGMKLVENPPDLDQWRERLFNVDETITITEEEFQTYFPHIDNVYSHRSTQKYKRKPFVSHYWDCRLKGRPPGTPKSSDPNKKKRRRTARERDLCDVKIKITEYFPGAAELMAQPNFGSSVDAAGGDTSATMNYLMDNNPSASGRHAGDNASPSQPFGILAPSTNLPPNHPGANGARYYTIQRINGAAAGDKSSDGPNNAASSSHKHTLAESDRVKKNSVQRFFLKTAKEAKKSQQQQQQQQNTNVTPTSQGGGDPSPTTSIPRSSPTALGAASGPASRTASLHAQPSDLILFGNAYCPFTQRVWIALEVKQIPYQYVEVVPEHMPGGNSARPKELLDVCPSAAVPCLRHGNWGAWESGILMEYLEDLSIGHPLLPLGEPQLRAHCRLWTDHINRKVLPAFYALLLTPPSQSSSHHSGQDPKSNHPTGPSSPSELHSSLTSTLQAAITALVNASHVTGPFFLGSLISFVDVAFAPWIIRLSRVLKYYRQWPDPEVGSRWEAWASAIEADERVKATVSDENSYHGVYREIGECGAGNLAEATKGKAMAEVYYAQQIVRLEGFGLGGDVWGPLDQPGVMQELTRMQER